MWGRYAVKTLFSVGVPSTKEPKASKDNLKLTNLSVPTIKKGPLDRDKSTVQAAALRSASAKL
jgi:hypothetical protein